MISTRFSLSFSALSLVAVSGTFVAACTAEFETECPEGTSQKGGGDVDTACVPAPAGSSGSADAGGSAGVAGVGGTGGSSQPPKGECEAGQKQCSADGLSECGADGQWQAPTACEIECDGAKNECVVPVQLAAGSAHACALLSNGTVRCWGNYTLGNAVFPQKIEGIEGAIRIKAGSFGECVFFADGSVSCWGDNLPNGANQSITKLPLDKVEDFTAGGSIFFCVIHHTSSVSTKIQCQGANADALYGSVGDGPNVASSDTLHDVVGLPSQSPLTQIYSGYAHTCGLSTEGSVYCWGDDSHGQIGFFSGENPQSAIKLGGQASADISSVSAHSYHSCAIRKDKTMVCWGENNVGQLGRGTGFTDASSNFPDYVKSISNVKQMALAYQHNCALTEDGMAWCWGINARGELGQSCSQLDCDNSSLGDFTRAPSQVPGLSEVEELVAGSNSGGEGFTCARKRDGSMYCWGDNQYGQLGTGRVSDFEATPQRVVWK